MPGSRSEVREFGLVAHPKVPRLVVTLTSGGHYQTMRRILVWLISATTENLPAQNYSDRARTRFFVGLLWVGLGVVSPLLLVNVVVPMGATFLVEVALTSFMMVTLDLIRRNRLVAAQELYAWTLPLFLSLLYFIDILTAVGVPEPTRSDYYLGFCLVNLVIQTVVTPSTRPFWIALGIALVTEFISVLGVLLPENPLTRHDEVWEALLRFLVLNALMTGILVRLQRIFQESSALYDQSQKALETQIAERTLALSESQERLERASASLSEGEKLASLGRIVAGIAHEMNTPLGAIQASSEHLSARATQILSDWTQLVPQIGPAPTQQLLKLIEQSESDVERLDSRRTRERRSEFAQLLTAAGVADPAPKGRVLADLGLKTIDSAWIPLLQSAFCDAMLYQATNLVEWQRAVSIIALSTSKVAEQVLGLRRYSLNPKVGKSAVPVDLAQNIETVLLVYRSQFPAGIKIHKNFPKTGPWVLGNPDRLMQVWSNLIMNAVQALGTSGKITLEARAGRAWATVQVTDNGPGIPREIQEKVLEPFFSPKSSGEGMGLGLKIVSSIVSGHEGSLSFESQPGKTTFRIRLPVGDAPE